MAFNDSPLNKNIALQIGCKTYSSVSITSVVSLLISDKTEGEKCKVCNILKSSKLTLASIKLLMSYFSPSAGTTSSDIEVK